MKKILVASTALAAVAFAGQASASEPIKLSVGGFMEQWAGFSDEDGAGIDSEGRPNAFQSDTEVHFDGSTTLDNGIEIGATVQLEGETSDDQIDAQYLYVNGGFGRFEMGKNDSAADAMGIIAPDVGPVGVNDGDMSNWVDVYLIDTVRSSGTQNRITYYTPILSGFRAGVSFADDSQANDETYNGINGAGDNIASAGLEYLSDFDGWSLGLSATGEESGDGAWYGFGANVGVGNFTVGGSYGHTEDDYGLNEDGQDLDAFDVGVSYAIDAASVSLSYGYEDFGTGDVQAVDLGLAYELGAGVAWQSSVFWFDQKNDTDPDNDGYGAVTGIRLDF